MGDHTSLPFLPGYSFTDPTVENFSRDQTLHYRKGCPIPDTITPSTAKYALELLDSENNLYDDTLVELTYGPRRTFLKKTPVPDFVSFDKQVLRFYGYYRQELDDTWGEPFRIRQVKVLYYLEDDTMELIEPKVPNSGLMQGLLLKRQKVPHPDGKHTYLWKDLNIGLDLIVYGKVIRLTDCDAWTKEYLLSGGIELNANIDAIPEDLFSKTNRKRELKPQHVTPKLEDEKLWKFLNKDGQVLRFYGLWDDSLNDPKEKRKVVILFFLVDDTIEVLEVHHKNDGRDPGAVLIRRQKIPLDLSLLPETFPTCYMEYSNKEIKEWFSPSHLIVGKTVVIFQRKILIYDCDKFTKDYYKNTLGMEMPSSFAIEDEPKPPVANPIPPHTGFGTWEDSLQSCLYVAPRPPKKDLLKELYNDNKYLRYLAYLDTVWEVDQSRKFVITLFLGDDTVQINELPVPNSGIASGCFLKKCRLPKIEKLPDGRPLYYTAPDFHIGAAIHASGRKFIITDADRYVLDFMEANPEIYSEEKLEAHRQKIASTRLKQEPLRSECEKLAEDLRGCVIEDYGKEPLKILLNLERDEWLPHIVKEKLQAANLPISKELLHQAIHICTVDNGKVDVDELQKILVNAFGQ